MTPLKTSLLLCVLGVTGCRLPHTNEDSKKTPLTPLAAAPPPISARFVNNNNAHEISHALNEEIERDLHSPINAGGEPAASSKK